MNKRRGFPTFNEAKKFLQVQRIKHPSKCGSWSIWDMKKSHPRRTKTRYFVGDYYDHLAE